MREFFGFGGYSRPAAGFLSPEHLLFVSFLVTLMIAAAVFFGLRNRDRNFHEKNKVLCIAAIAIDALELFKIVLTCIRSGNPRDCLYMLPLFLCSIQLIVLPLAAFSRGRLQQTALDFVLIFGLMGAILGTYGAGNDYSTYPVLCFDNLVSGLTHTLAGFASLYIAITGMASMKRKNLPCTFLILLSFCGAALLANHLLSYNYMFLVRGDGTPYDIFYNLVSGHPIWYPTIVISLFLLYISTYYALFWMIRRKCAEKHTKNHGSH